jgi:hypothetical protein
MVDRETNGILKRLVSEWEHLKVEMERLRSSAAVRPGDGYKVFQAVDSQSTDVASFTLSRVVFNVPERANDQSIDLFVVVEGRLSFKRKDFAERDVLATHEFATKVAYFRRTPSALTHVYGAHYDFALNELGHPVFHGQMRGYPEFAEAVKASYSIDHDVIDCVGGLLRSVRVPTAQMDVFSFFIQLCADHMLYSKSGPEEKAAFNSLLARGAFCQGAAFQVPRLESDDARSCYRSRHWYPSIA